MSNIDNQPSTSPQKNNSKLIPLIVGGMIVVIGLILFLVFKGGANTANTAAGELRTYFPEDTLVYAELDLTPEKLDKLKNLTGTAITFDKITESVKQAAKNPTEALEAVQLLNELNSSLEPVLAMGIWSQSEDTLKPDQVVFASVIKNKDKIPALMTKLTKGQSKFEPKTIDGHEFNVAAGESGGAYTIQDNILMFSDKADTLKAAIENHDTRKGNVFTTSQATEILTNLPEQRFLTVLINTSKFNKMTANSNVPTSTPDVNNKMKQLEDITKSMSYTGIGMDVKDNLIEAKSYTPFNLDSVKDKVLKDYLDKLINVKSSFNGPKILPGDSFMYVSLYGVSYFIQLTNQFLGSEELASFNQQKQMLKMVTGLDLETDVIPLFSEELTLAGRVDNNDVDPIVIITNKPQSLQVLTKLVSSMTAMDPTTTVSEQEINGIKMSLIGSRTVPFKVGFAAVNDLIVLGKANTIETIIGGTKDSSKTLSNAGNYKALGEQVLTNSNVVFYMNPEKLSEATKIMNKNAPQSQQMDDYYKNIDGVILSFANNTNNKAIIGNLLIKFKPAK